MGKGMEVVRAMGSRVQLFPQRVRAFRALPNHSKRVFIRALILNPVFRLTVKYRGLKSAARLARRLGGVTQIHDQSEASLTAAREVVLGVRAAAGALPIEVVCLPRSLSAWTLLRRQGVGSSLLIGWDHAVDKRTAHAWVDVGGEAVGENPDHIARLAAFDDPILGCK